MCHCYSVNIKENSIYHKSTKLAFGTRNITLIWTFTEGDE